MTRSTAIQRALSCVILALMTIATTACIRPPQACHAMKPTLPSAVMREEGGICIDRADTAALMRYVAELEACAR